jgi:cyclopentanol dehydrogenase
MSFQNNPHGRGHGLVAIISGGARGLGEAQARLFAKEGAKVVIGDILEVEGTKVVDEINAVGGEALFIKLDVTQAKDWQRIIDTAVTRFGKLNVLVNNAGIGGASVSIADMTEDMWDEVMDVNAKGVFLGTKLVIPEMLKTGSGSIVNISSQIGIVGSDTSNLAYQASKAAVHLFTKAVALRYATKGIRVNSVHPGPIQTPMLAEGFVDKQRQRKVLSRIPMGRVGKPEEIAYGVLFLASEEASFITGTELVIDGGYLAQ